MIKKKIIFIQAAIVIFWLTMMTFLIRDHVIKRDYGKPVEITPDELTLKWKDKEEWMKVSLSGKQVGVYLMKIIRDIASDEFRVVNRLNIEPRLIGYAVPISLDSVIYLKSNFVISEFVVNIKALFKKILICGLNQGSDLFIRWDVNGAESFAKIEMTKQASFYNAIIPALSSQRDLQVGKTFKIPAYDPIWASNLGEVVYTVKARQKIELNKKEFQAFRVETTLGNMKTVSYVLPTGDVLRQELPYNITLERMSKADAMQRYSAMSKEPQYKRIVRKDFISRSKNLKDMILPDDTDATTTLSSAAAGALASSDISGKFGQGSSPVGIFNIFSSLFKIEPKNDKK